MPKQRPIAGQQPETVPVMMAQQFGNINDFSYKALIYFLKGSQVSFQVTDSQNQTSNVVSFTVTSGDSSACEVKYYPGIQILEPGETSDPNLKIDPPDIETDACYDYFFLSWGITGTPPYVFTAQTVGLTVLQAASFGNVSGGIPNFQVPFPSGDQIVFGVQDSVGRQSFTRPITIQPYILPSNSCVISNLTSANNDKSVPIPTTKLPFPSFYPFSTTGPTSRTTTGRATPTSRSGGGVRVHASSNAGLVIGLVFGIPAAVMILGGLLAALLLLHRKRQRQEMVQAYWNAKIATDTGAQVLSPRLDRPIATPYSG